jgi:organic radical activating enzyme
MVKQVKRIYPNKNKWVSITWQVNDVCNFRCSYCNEYNWGGRHRNGNTEEICRNLDKIMKHYKSKGYEYFKIFFSGGEPTFWDPLFSVIETFENNAKFPGSCVGINSNLSRPLKWWKEHHHKFDDVVGSYHIEFTDEKKYLKNYEYLSTRKNWMCARLMMHKDHFQHMIDVGEKIKKFPNTIIEYAPVFDELKPDTDPYHYDEKWMEEWLMKNPMHIEQESKPESREIKVFSMVEFEDGTSDAINTNSLIANKQNFFNGWKCHIDEAIHIMPNGDMSLASCGVGPKIGNIVRGQFINSNAKPIICPKLHCHCAADINITKYRKEHA